MKDPGTPEGSLWNTAVSSEPGSAGRAAGSKHVHQELIDIGATISGTIQPTRTWNCLSKVCAGGAGRLELVKLVGSGCAPSLTSVDQLLEQELREQCLLLRLSQWFGSPCGCSRGALTPRKRRWQHRVLYFGICGVSPSWKAADWSLSELVGPHLCQKAAVLPVEWRGSFPSHLDNGREQSPPGLSLLMAFPLQGEISGHSRRSCWSVPAPASPLTLFSVSQL